MIPVSRLLPSLGAILLLSFTLSSCSAPSGSAGDRKGLFGGNKKWQEGYEGALAGNGWNNNLPAGSLAGAKSSYSRVTVSEPYVAMTFDDGPHPSNTPRLLDILKQRNVKATFFVVGTNAKAYPHILQRMVAEGHEVANHTWSHADVTKISSDSVRNELNTTRDAIVAATGVQPKTFRPPYGAVNSNLKTWIQQEYGYPTIMWSVDPMDWKNRNAAIVSDRLVNGAHKGGILLAHDIHKTTIDAMPSTLDRLLSQGYRFVTVSQLINLERGTASTGSPQPAPMHAPHPGHAPQPNPGFATPVPNPIPVSRDAAKQEPTESDEDPAEVMDSETAPEADEAKEKVETSEEANEVADTEETSS